MGAHRRTANVWVARSMPVLMAGTVGFATWVFLSLVCVNHLLVRQERTATAAILITIYAVLLLLLATSYLRTVVTLIVNPGYVPKGPPRDVEPPSRQLQLDGAEDGCSETGSRDTAAPASVNSTEGLSSPPLPRPLAVAAAPDRLSADPSDPVPQTPNSTTLLNPPSPHLSPLPNASNGVQGRPYTHNSRPHPDAAPSNLRDFLDKEIFVCEGDGLPRYCSKCNCWKPDRSHHCSEIERCVWRMDHFCPWVGGCVAETSFRYFFQVVVYGMLYCLCLIVSMGVIMRERSNNGDSMDTKWLATLVLACIFGVFSAGMALSTAQLIVRNLGTVDSLSAEAKVYQLAIHDPNPPVNNPDAYRPIGPRVWLPVNTAPGESQRCFAIVRTQPGENPWMCDSTYENFCSALGGGFLQWFALSGVPKPGSTGGERGFYQWNNTIIARLKKEVGIRNNEKA
ncbi:DHHC palmitoyltransferase-domain-containing protein [Tricharina praecox]|uniref:DHHC palmitoyltransferase-domain-containing protein n=1 Tax=Tricharina praecox TaxID=43433 RepID=UPI00221E7E5A|nr:DHHC palmitoyltransferase-domain-containing protein [Tricharina praecox]KAI5856451.1 DHHC palmitoyltransferase-domain-containing protein [Tricharina praecox]